MGKDSQKKVFSPNISRFITEEGKNLAFSMVATMLVIGIFVQGLSLTHNLSKQEDASNRQKEISAELDFWKEFIGKNGDYRDVYYRMAELEYKLGNINEARLNLAKVEELDPNFKDADVLGVKIEE